MHWVLKVVAAMVAVGTLAMIGLGLGLVAPGFVGVVAPCLALFVFIVGIGARVATWGKAPVPFRIPTTCGQQKSLAWIKADELEAPSTNAGVLLRMALEVFAFRSLFRNTRAELKKDHNFGHVQEMFLWVAAIAFHYCLLAIVLRHGRFFLEPVPYPIRLLNDVDGWFEILLPAVFISDLALLAALGYLFFRRLYYPEVRYISLLNDYFPLVLIGTIVLTGMAMRHVPLLRVDLESVKILAAGIFGLHFGSAFAAAPKIGPTFFIHVFLVSVLLAYFPFSKLLHLPGIFMSPTRNLANNSRAVRHVNPWNPEVKVHSYREYEEEFHDLMKDAGLPLDQD